MTDRITLESVLLAREVARLLWDEEEVICVGRDWRPGVESK